MQPKLIPLMRYENRFAAEPVTKGKRHSILCIGNDLNLLMSRCAVLATDGYEAQTADPVGAANAFRTNRFDLVVLCATLSSQQVQTVKSELPLGTTSLALEGFIMPTELLAAVANALGKRRDSGKTSGPFGNR